MGVLKGESRWRTRKSYKRWRNKTKSLELGKSLEKTSHKEEPERNWAEGWGAGRWGGGHERG